MPRRPHLLHVFPSFAAGGAEVRTTQIMNRLGGEFTHSVISMSGKTGAAGLVNSSIAFELLAPPPSRNILLRPLQFRRIIQRAKPDLLLTYNWGATEATMAARLFSLCPVVHTEDGFGADEARQLKRRRVLTRRFILNSIERTVVPSQTLLRVALEQYRLRPDKVKYIPNGIDTRRFAPASAPDSRLHLGFGPGPVFGFVGHFRPEKNLTLMLRAFAEARLPESARLVLVGGGEGKQQLEDMAHELGLEKQIRFTGPAADPLPYYAAFDVFLLSSATEQMPLSLLEAMACGLPAICTDVGDVGVVLDSTEAPVVVPANNIPTYADAIRRFAADANLRHALGARNRARCLAAYSIDRMIEGYRDVYWQALGLPPAG